MGSWCGFPLVCPLFFGVILLLILPVRRDPLHGGYLCCEVNVSSLVGVGSCQCHSGCHQDLSTSVVVGRVLRFPVGHMLRAVGLWLLQAGILLPLCFLWHVSMV